MRIHILLDPTKSMGADGKWDYARQLAIALGHIALKSGDTVSFSTWADGQDNFFRKKGAAHRASITKLISAIDDPGSTESFTDRALASIPKAVTVLFIMTDGLEEVGKWEHLFRRLAWYLWRRTCCNCPFESGRSCLIMKGMSDLLTSKVVTASK